MSELTPTPRTDAKHGYLRDREASGTYTDYDAFLEMTDHAREIESEFARYKARVTGFSKQYADEIEALKAIAAKG